ncbi:DUF2716 domain-containing protein [Brevibacillus sp. HB1.4B]|uniref:DUF2716 domain-containing protein n=1 Tax=Brevibacillus sp. HB1.4B TaxID=2738845 RepID=UPI0020C4A252|nr:DUF2716 domain-containing protein [Brevibacillus sp. HB1.4B]
MATEINWPLRGDGNNWIPLSDEQYRLVWGKFCKDFNFKLSIHSSDWPSFRLLIPFVTFDITEYTDDEIT